jgi:ketosteroid isomerase-like protein
VDEALRRLIDERDIYRLLVHYAERIDANDPEGAADCFTADGVGIYWGEYRGRAAIAARLGGILDDFSATSHHLSNVSIEVSGDRATALSYVYAFHRLRRDDSPLHVWGRWIDRIERAEDGWRFARREVARVGRLSPVTPDGPVQLQPHPGRLDRSPET